MSAEFLILESTVHTHFYPPVEINNSLPMRWIIKPL